MTRVIVDTLNEKATISRHIYGHFAEHLGRCIYGGLFENGKIRDDVLTALKELDIPVLRWPGGCFSDEYHWKDGIGKNRKRMVNGNWGKVVEDNSFGTHEYMELVEKLGCEPYICGNFSSGTVQEMSEWIEYLSFDGESPMANMRCENGHAAPWRIKYFGIGNEPWGFDGHMSAEYYANRYKVYSNYCRDYGDNKLFRIISGPGVDCSHLRLDWTDTVMREAGDFVDGLAIHYYTIPGDEWGHKGSSTCFSEDEYKITLKKALFLDEIIRKHAAVMERYDPEKRVKIIFDEWGTWFDVEPGTNPSFLYQQNTMRDALVAAVSLNIFSSHADIVHMANIAQIVNVLQAMVLTEGEKMLKTPTYYIFKMFKTHQDALALETLSETGVACASRRDGKITLTLVNMSADTPKTFELTLLGGKFELIDGKILAGKPNAHNTFEQPEIILERDFDAFTIAEYNKCGTLANATLPPCSVVAIILKES